ncbi:MAG: DUF1911 domain-containing protein [Cytophagaceae bacterium]|nr:MAG: DUF1911 domain-containing protein [Cytophagaceae bacterium]
MALLTREQFGDKLITYLLNPEKLEDNLTQLLLFPDDEGLNVLWAVTKSAKEKAADRMKLYLEKYWYTSDNLDTSFNSHLNKKVSHYSYWSYEDAAITKIMKLDDSTFQNNEFYPYDLVHWQD